MDLLKRVMTEFVECGISFRFVSAPPSRYAIPYIDLDLNYKSHLHIVERDGLLMLLERYDVEYVLSSVHGDCDSINYELLCTQIKYWMEDAAERWSNHASAYTISGGLQKLFEKHAPNIL